MSEQPERRDIEEQALRERIGQLRMDLLVRCNQDETAIELPLLSRAAQWAGSEDPERLADLTGIPLVEVRRIASAFRFSGTWPQSHESDE